MLFFFSKLVTFLIILNFSFSTIFTLCIGFKLITAGLNQKSKIKIPPGTSLFERFLKKRLISFF